LELKKPLLKQPLIGIKVSRGLDSHIKKLLPLIILMMMISFQSSVAQVPDYNEIDPKQIYMRNMHGEILGTGIGLSISHEWLWEETYGGRIGIGTSSGILLNAITVPATVVYVFGDDHQLETGLGLTGLLKTTKNQSMRGFENKFLAMHLLVGYRFFEREGFIIRINGVMLTTDERTLLWGGMGIGLNLAP
jgi:hypothetical protein